MASVAAETRCRAIHAQRVTATAPAPAARIARVSPHLPDFALRSRFGRSRYQLQPASLVGGLLRPVVFTSCRHIFHARLQLYNAFRVVVDALQVFADVGLQAACGNGDRLAPCSGTRRDLPSFPRTSPSRMSPNEGCYLINSFTQHP